MAIKPRTNDVRPNKRVRTIFFFPFSRYNAREQFTFLPFLRWFRSSMFVKMKKTSRFVQLSLKFWRNVDKRCIEQRWFFLGIIE